MGSALWYEGQTGLMGANVDAGAFCTADRCEDLDGTSPAAVNLSSSWISSHFCGHSASRLLEMSTMADQRVGKPKDHGHQNNIEACSFSVANVDLNKNTDAK